MSVSNPYASPSASGFVAPRPRWFRRDGKFIVVRTGAVLPARCVRTNEDIGDRMKEKQLMWVPRWSRILPPVLCMFPVGLLFLYQQSLAMSWILFVGVAGIAIAGLIGVGAQKRLKVTYGIYRRWRWTMVQCLSVTFGMGAYFLLSNGDGACREYAFLALIAGSMIAGIFQHPLRVVRYQDGEFWLKGASPEFLDLLAPSSSGH